MNFLTSFISQYFPYLLVTLLSSTGLVFFLSVIKKENFKKDSKKVITYFLLVQLITIIFYLVLRKILNALKIYPGEDTDILFFIFLNFLSVYIETSVFYKLNSNSDYSNKNKGEVSNEYQKEIFLSVTDFCLLLVLILVPLYFFGNGSMNNFILFVLLDILVVFFTHTVLLPTVLKKYSKSSK